MPVQSSTEYVHTNDSETLEIFFQVSYTIEEFSPQTWWEPASGGGPVDVAFSLESVRAIRDPFNPRVIPKSKLGPRWIKQVERDMEKRWEDDDRTQERVCEAISREEGDREESRYGRRLYGRG